MMSGLFLVTDTPVQCGRHTRPEEGQAGMPVLLLHYFDGAGAGV